jgi:DeoR family glycerol-3-phosphate regulon repressor
VLTPGSVGVDGVLDYDLNEAEVAIAMLAPAQALTVLADSSKFARAGLFPVCALAEVDRLVTNQPPQGALATAAESAGVEWIVAAVSESGAGA